MIISLFGEMIALLLMTTFQTKWITVYNHRQITFQNQENKKIALADISQDSSFDSTQCGVQICCRCRDYNLYNQFWFIVLSHSQKHHWWRWPCWQAVLLSTVGHSTFSQLLNCLARSSAANSICSVHWKHLNAFMHTTLSSQSASTELPKCLQPVACFILLCVSSHVTSSTYLLRHSVRVLYAHGKQCAWTVQRKYTIFDIPTNWFRL